MTTYLFKMTCITDLHVGNGDANYSVIDNEVQKDSVLGMPIIHASGLKGALKEHFETVWGKTDQKTKHVFGSEGKEGQGNYKFFTAQLLARPLRVSSGDRSYILTTSEEILKNFSSFLQDMGLGDYYSYQERSRDLFSCSNLNIKEIEGDKAIEDGSLEKAKQIIGDEVAFCRDLNNYELPARARNSLDENGQSLNVWYEEIVPHKSIFYFVVISDGAYDEVFLSGFENAVIQVGGNASVGNGYTKIEKVWPE